MAKHFTAGFLRGCPPSPSAGAQCIWKYTKAAEVAGSGLWKPSMKEPCLFNLPMTLSHVASNHAVNLTIT